MTRIVEQQRAGADHAGLDSSVGDLQAGLPGWVDLPLQERIALLADVRRRVGKEAAGIVAALREAQGLPAGSHWEGDVWFGLAPWANQISALEVAMGRAAAGRDVVAPGAIHVRDDGRVVVDVFPVTLANRVFMLGYRGQVWLQPGVTPDQARAEAGSGYRDGGAQTAGVALLLAAGNLPCLPGMDALTLLFQRRCTVAMKLNPVNAYLRPFLERIFADFTAAGWLRFVDGGADVGQYLAHHPGIDRIHMTGSAATYNALVWGVGDQADHNRAAGTPLLSKPFDAELGGVNPLIVVPGKWGGQDIRRQADRIVFSRLFNCGHICTSTQVLVLAEGWDQAEQLLDAIRDLMRTLEPRTPYYPGTEAKVARAIAGQPESEALIEPDRRFLVTDLDPADQCSLFSDEVFADVLGVVRLPAPDVTTYLQAATQFANDTLAGTLAATILIDPATAKEHAQALDRAVEDLRYGLVGVNEWAGYQEFGFPTRGAFPGHTPQDIGSGVGVVNNAFLLPQPEKSVLTSWFRSPIKPFSTASHRTLADSARGYIDYSTTEDPTKIPGIFWNALRG